MSTPSDDAQRELEQRALRNVRALVDKYEDKDASDAKSVRKLAIRIVVGVLVIFAIIWVAIELKSSFREQVPAATYVLPPPGKAAK